MKMMTEKFLIIGDVNIEKIKFHKSQERIKDIVYMTKEKKEMQDRI